MRRRGGCLPLCKEHVASSLGLHSAAPSLHGAALPAAKRGTVRLSTAASCTWACGCRRTHLPLPLRLPPTRRRKEKRGDVDATYLKNVLLQAFESGGQRQAAGEGQGQQSPCSAVRAFAFCGPCKELAPGGWAACPACPPGPNQPCRAWHCLGPLPLPAGELPANSTMVPILARLLEFSPSELRRVQDKAAAASGSGAGAAALFAGMPAFKLPQLPGLPGLPGSK